MVDKSSPQLHLNLLPHPHHILQYPYGHPIPHLQPPPADSGSFLSVSYTANEVSIVISSKPDEGREAMEGFIGAGKATEYEGPWRVINIAGPLDLSFTGILNSLTTPLREAAIPIFAISTWNTDYVLIPWNKSGEAQSVLQKDGWAVSSS